MILVNVGETTGSVIGGIVEVGGGDKGGGAGGTVKVSGSDVKVSSPIVKFEPLLDKF